MRDRHCNYKYSYKAAARRKNSAKETLLTGNYRHIALNRYAFFILKNKCLNSLTHILFSFKIRFKSKAKNVIIVYSAINDAGENICPKDF